MRVKEVAARLSVAPSMIYALVASGRLQCYRLGKGKGVLRFEERHVTDYLGGTEPAPPVPPPSRLNLKHLSL